MAISTQNKGLISQLPAPIPGKEGWPWTIETNPDLFDLETKYPKISIVTPSYNQGQFIEETIRSVLLQNYPNLEYIIVDGGSTDNTLEIIKKYENWITCWISEADEGQSQALNKGFDRCTGEIYGWLNSDDIYTEKSFYNSINGFLYTSKKIIFGDYLSIDSNSNILNCEYVFDFSLKQFMYEGFHINAQAMFWEKSVHERFGIFNENLHRTMDYDMIIRFGNNEGEKEFLRLDNIVLGCFRRHMDQKTIGMDQIVIDEHRMIAYNNNFMEKYSLTGHLFRFLFRFRRFHWYLKRGGLVFTIKKMLRR